MESRVLAKCVEKQLYVIRDIAKKHRVEQPGMAMYRCVHIGTFCLLQKVRSFILTVNGHVDLWLILGQ